MRRIGMTDQVGDSIEIIVYMSRDEWETFKMLEAAVREELPNDFDQVSPLKGIDLAPTFKAMTAWIRANFRIARLQNLLDELGNVLKEYDE